MEDLKVLKSDESRSKYVFNVRMVRFCIWMQSLQKGKTKVKYSHVCSLFMTLGILFYITARIHAMPVPLSITWRLKG